MPPLCRHMSAIFTRAILDTVGPTPTDNTARWAFIGAVGLISATGLWALGVRVAWDSLRPLFERPALFLVFAVAYGAIGRQCIASRAADGRSLGLSAVRPASNSDDACVPAVVLPSYLAAAPDFPLLDPELARLDALLFGFEWDAAARWVADRPALDQVLQTAYFSAAYQVVAILLIGSIARPHDRNS
jgi:hypothetical protein